MSVRRTIPRGELGAAIGQGIEGLVADLGAAGVAAIGPPYVRYHDATDHQFDIEVGFPVVSWVEVDGVDLTELPACRVAATTHVGHYTKLPDAVGALRDWIGANSESAGACWEVYWTNPNEVPVEEWRTDVLWPITGTV